MDPYTARCLQVSTSASDGAALQRRRPSGMMKRQNSVVDSRSVPVRPTHTRSKTSITGMWPVQTDVPNVPSYPSTTTPMSMQSARFTSPSSSGASPFEGPYQFPYMTPITPYTPNEWSLPMTLDAKQLQGLGMDLSEQSFALNGNEAQEDLIHMNASGMWDIAADSISPGRRSSTAGSDMTEVTDSTVPSAAASTYEGMMGSRDERRSRSLHRHSRSLSRTPASRAASKRTHRRQLSCQPVPHGRNMSVGGYMPTLPQTPAVLHDQAAHEALAMEFGSHEFLNSNMHDSDMGMETDFQNNFDVLMDAPMSISQSAPSHAARMAGTAATTPPNDMIFWDQSAYEVTDLLSSPSNHADEHEHHDGCCSTSNSNDEDEEKPDLFESLRQEPSNPPEEDMHPEDADMVPQEQEPRFEGDMYTPRWVRGQGNKREGYCGLCKPGRWLVLKNSAYWYDKSFTHGISASTGQPFEAPKETRRMAGNPDVWEGLCGGCGDWIALVSSKKRGTTWFRHAYKCHSKSKDGNKKARQASPAKQPHAYANMKPVPMPEAHTQRQHRQHQQHQHQQHQHQQQQPPHSAADMFSMGGMNAMNTPMVNMSGLDMHPGDAAAFSEMTFL